jgi:hypothetical protein
MSAGTILSVLSKIPWNKVVENAPVVADAAENLWKRVTRRTAESTVVPDEVSTPLSEADALTRRVASLERSMQTVQEEMRASSQLIKTLAEQNTVLVQRIELNRVKLVRLAAVTGIGLAVLLALVVFLLVRP